MKMLIDAGAKIGRQNELALWNHFVSDNNPLGIAMMDINLEAVKMLLEADVYICCCPKNLDDYHQLVVVSRLGRYNAPLTQAQKQKIGEIFKLLRAKYLEQHKLIPQQPSQ
jgi:hypothetical protein